MKTMIIIALATAAAFTIGVAREVGSYCEQVNPYAPEDYPKGDIGADF